MFASEYEARYGTETSYSNSYANYAATAPFPTAANRIVNVVTSTKSQNPHPSAWNLAGSTPELFLLALHRAVDSVVRNNQKRIITIYNVSEWAEGGPGLIPQKRDGVGYLNAIKAVAPQPLLTVNAGKVDQINVGTGDSYDRDPFRSQVQSNAESPGTLDWVAHLLRSDVVGDPFTGEYVLAQVGSVADGRISTADRQATYMRGGRG